MDYQTKTKLILPFRGTWMVSNGGRSEETNNHVRFAQGDGPKNQIYAYDFRRGHTGEGKKLEDYDVYGQDVIAPADGVVIQVVNGAIDVLPGERDRAVGCGNTIQKTDGIKFLTVTEIKTSLPIYSHRDRGSKRRIGPTE